MDKSPFSTVIAAILAALAILLLSATVVAVNMQRHLMNPETYKDTFAQQDLYQHIPELVAGQLTENLSKPEGKQAEDAPAVFLFLDTDDWTLILEEVMDEAWSRRQVEAVIDGVFTLFNGEAEAVQIPISLQELKTAFSGPGGERILKMMFGSLPDCTLEDVGDFVTRLIFEGTFELPSCSLPDEVLDPILNQVHALITPAVETIPDLLVVTLTRSDFEVTNPMRSGKSSNLVDRYQTVRTLIRFGPWVIGVLLALITVVAVRSWQDLLVWWGWPLFIGGAVIWLPLLLGGKTIARLLESYIALRAPRVFSAEVVEMAATIIGQIVREMFIPLKEQAGWLLAAGLTLLALASVIKWRTERTLSGADPES